MFQQQTRHCLAAIYAYHLYLFVFIMGVYQLEIDEHRPYQTTQQQNHSSVYAAHLRLKLIWVYLYISSFINMN